MSLLNVKVKMARYIGDQVTQFSTYATLKLQNVKCTTVTVKGANPCWQQDFLFETNDVNTGLLVEVWRRGFLLDYAIGYHMVSLPTVRYSNEDGEGEWVSLDAELEMSDGVVCGTRCPTGHFLLIDARFELPFGPYDPPTGWKEILGELNSSTTAPPSASASGDNDEMCDMVDYQKKFEMLNTFDQDSRSEDVSAQFQYYGQSAGNSEDSDYTSDFNYPICQQQANSSASQFRNLAGQLDMSPTSSPEHLPVAKTDGINRHNMYDPQAYDERRVPDENLYYNSRPSDYKDQKRRKNDLKLGDTGEWYEEGSSTTFHEQERFASSSRHSCKKHISKYHQRKTNKIRRSSLERQTSMYRPPYYDEYYDNGSPYEQYDNKQKCESVIPYGSSNYYNNEPSEVMYNYENSYSYSNQKEEDSQWDGGGENEYYYSPELSETHQLKTTYPIQQAVDEENEEIYYSPNHSYDYQEMPFEVPPPAIPAQRHKQLPEIPMKKQPYMDYYSNSFYSEPQVSITKKILPRIPQSRIKQSPSLQQTYQKTLRRNSMEQRSSSFDHKENYEEYTDRQYDEYDEPGYNYNGNGHYSQQEKQLYSQDTGINEYDNSVQREQTEDKKPENGEYNRRDTFMKFYQRTVKHIESPRIYLQQQHTDSMESQEDRKEDSFETAVSSISTSNRRWMQDSSKPSSYEHYKSSKDETGSLGGGGYTLRTQDSAESYQEDLLPIDEHEVQESPRVLPSSLGGSNTPVDIYSNQAKRFSPSASLQQQQLQQSQPYQPFQQIHLSQQQQQQKNDEDDLLDEDQEDLDNHLDMQKNKELLLTDEMGGARTTIIDPSAPEDKRNLARVRWHKAYNKIVHQLNVSTLYKVSLLEILRFQDLLKHLIFFKSL